MIQKLSWLALAGALGTVARYGLAGVVYRLNTGPFPWGTIAVNITGCFLAGFLWTLFEHRWPVTGEVRTAVLVGFLGAFTTFSTLILETGEMLRLAEWMNAAGNITFQNVLGIAALFAGLAIGRII